MCQRRLNLGSGTLSVMDPDVCPLVVWLIMLRVR